MNRLSPRIRGGVIAFMLVFGAPLAARPDTAAPFDLTIYKDGDTYLRPTIALEAAIYSESNAWLGESRSFMGDHVGYWYEWAVTGGLEGALALPDAGLLFGRASAIGTGTQGLDAAGSNFDNRYPEKLELEDLYLGWKSAQLLPSLGENALQISVGKQKYQIDEGFFMWDGASDGGVRGAYWLAPRKAFYMSGIVRLHTGPYKAEGFYLKPNDEPFTGTNVAGANFEYEAKDTGTIGFTYLNVYDSQRKSRDGLNFFDWRLALTPLPMDRNVLLKGEYAYEQNPNFSFSRAWYAEAGYTFDKVGGKPFVSYRYADFGSTKVGLTASQESQVWDPLFYGFYDWSSWYVGEIVGEFVTINRGLVMQTGRLRAEPIAGVTTSLLYTYYRLSGSTDEIAARDLNPRVANIKVKHLGQEFDFVTDYSATSYLSFSGVIAAFDPGSGMQQYVNTNSGSWWLHFMFYTKVAF